MKHKKVYGICYGVVSLLLIINLIYRLFNGLPVGIQEVTLTVFFTIASFYMGTWGSKENRDGILPNEELGKTIERKSMAYSYYPIAGMMWIGLIIDRLLTDTVNVTLLIIMTVTLIIPSVSSFIITQTYAVEPTIIGKAASEVIAKLSQIKRKTILKIASIVGLTSGLFVIEPVFDDSRSYYALLVYLFGDTAETGVNPLSLLLSAGIILLVGFIVYQIYQAADETD